MALASIAGSNLDAYGAPVTVPAGTGFTSAGTSLGSLAGAMGTNPVAGTLAPASVPGVTSNIGQLYPTSSVPISTRGGGGPAPGSKEYADRQSGGGGGSGSGSGGSDGKSGWDTAYAANDSQAQPYYDEFAAAANARLGSIEQGGIDQSLAVANMAGRAGFTAMDEARATGQGYGTALSNVGQYYGDQQAAAGQGYGAGAAAVGQAAGNAAGGVGQYYGDMLTGVGQYAGQTGRDAWTQANQTAAGIAGAGSQALSAGVTGGMQANQYANNIAATGGLGMTAAQQAQQGIGGAVQATQQAGQQAAAMGQQGANAINATLGGIQAAGQAGQQAGQAGQQAAAQAASGIGGAAAAGQRALTGLGQQQGDFGSTAAQQGLRFLGDQGYQQNLTEANVARNQARAAGAQLGAIEAQEGPSAAQAQLRAGLNAAQSSNLAMARSGRGFGGSASALRSAAVQNAQAGQQAANQAAALRAQETAAFRQRQAANLASSANVQLQAGQQVAAQQQQLAAAQLAQTEANRQAYLQSQGLGQTGLAQQAATEAQARQMALTGAQAAGQMNLAGAGMGLQGAGMGLTAAQAQAATAAQAAQTGMAGAGQNVAAQQAAIQGLTAGGQMGLAGAQQMTAAQQAAAQTGLAGNAQLLQAAGMNIDALQAGGQLGLAGAGLAQQGAQNQIAAQQAASQQALQGILGGGQLGVSGLTQGGQLALGGLQQASQSALTGLGQGGQLALGGITQGGALGLQGTDIARQSVGQAGTIGLAAEQQRAANAQYMYGLAENETARDLQIAGMQAGLNVQAANMQNQGIGAGVGAAAAMLPLLLMSDVRNKENIAPADAQSAQVLPMTPDLAGASSNLAGEYGRMYSEQAAQANAGQSPSEMAGRIGSDFASQARAKNMAENEAEQKKKEKMIGGFQGIGRDFASSMAGGGMNPAINPITGQPWMMSDERGKYLSDERDKTGASSGSSAALEAFANAPGYSYEYRDPNMPGAAPGRHFGPMAQDLERTPAGRSVVEEGPNGKMVNVPRLTMLEASAMSALNEKVDALAAKIRGGSKQKKAA